MPKMYRGGFTAEFHEDALAAPMALAVQVEALLNKAAADLRDLVLPVGGRVVTSSAFVNAREGVHTRSRKTSETPSAGAQQPTPLETAIAAVGQQVQAAAKANDEPTIVAGLPIGPVIATAPTAVDPHEGIPVFLRSDSTVSRSAEPVGGAPAEAQAVQS